MSYILDALRKAERDRPRGMVRVPAPPSVPASGVSRYWPWALGGVIALNAAIVTWMVWPGVDTRPDHRPAMATSPALSRTTAARAGTAVGPARGAGAPGPMVARERIAETPAPPAVEPAPAARPTAPVPRTATPAVAPSAPRPAAPKAVPAERSPAPSTAAALATPVPAAPAATPSVPAPAATPREHAQTADAQLQRRRLQFVAYSDVAAERFVFIDNQKLVEGQTIDNGVVVERIDPASVVLKHPGGRVILRADPGAAR